LIHTLPPLQNAFSNYQEYSEQKLVYGMRYSSKQYDLQEMGIEKQYYPLSHFHFEQYLQDFESF